MNNLFTLNQILGYSLLASGLLALPQLSTRWGGYGLPNIARFRPDGGLRTLPQRWPRLGHRCWLILPVVLMLLLWLNGLMLVIARGSGPVAWLAAGRPGRLCRAGERADEPGPGRPAADPGLFPRGL